MTTPILYASVCVQILRGSPPFFVCVYIECGRVIAESKGSIKNRVEVA